MYTQNGGFDDWADFGLLASAVKFFAFVATASIASTFRRVNNTETRAQARVHMT